MSVRHDGAEIPLPGRLRAVLATLLVRAGQLVPAAELADSVWGPDHGPAAQVTLRSYVKRLRQFLGPVAGRRIITANFGYLIEVEADELDLLRFGSLFQAGGLAVRGNSWQRASELLTEALALWRGSALADVPSDALQLSETSRLEELRLQALEWRVDADLRMGHVGPLIAELESLVTVQPLRERFHAQLMTALHQCGRQAEALAAYRRARELIVRELGVEPGPDLQILHQRMLRGEATAAGCLAPAAPPRQLPAAAAGFTGRAEELRKLTGLLEHASGPDREGTVWAIDGPPGVGKTALALHWAHQAAGRFPDGQLYVNLRGFDPSGTPLAPHDAVRGFLQTFGVPVEQIPAGLDAMSGLYRSLLAGKRMLIVLDNACDADQVRPLLPGAPGCLVLVTSRTQLAELSVDAAAQILTLDVLGPAESRELLTRRVGPGRSAREPAACVELASLCAGLPLALAIAAARVAARPAFPLGTLVDELRVVRHRLDALDAGGATASVRAAISWSYRHLDAPTARMFRLLAVHPGPDISVAAAASLAAVTRETARGLLTELNRACLLTEQRPGRYGFHDLLRAYALDEAETAEGSQWQAAAHRLLDHYQLASNAAAAALQPAWPPLSLEPASLGVLPERPGTHLRALAWFDAEHLVLRRVIELARDAGQPRLACQLSLALAVFLYRRARWAELVAMLERALLAAERDGDQHGLAHCHRQLGRAHGRLREFAKSQHQLGLAIMLYRQAADQVGLAWANIDLAVVYEAEGRIRDALACSEQALDLFRAAGCQAGEAAALNAIGWDYAQAGEPEQARPACERALSLYQDLRDRAGEAYVWDTLGFIHHRLGHHQQALDSYRHSLALLEHLEDLHTQAQVLSRLAEACHAVGDNVAAAATCQDALAILYGLEHADADAAEKQLARYVGP